MARVQSRNARRTAPRIPRHTMSDDGFVAVDAMVALLIISLATILSLQAVRVAHQAASTAREYSRANVLLAYILDAGPRSFAPTTGVTDGFSWQLVTQTTGFDRPIAVCRRALTMRANGTGRAFQASTLEACPAESPG